MHIEPRLPALALLLAFSACAATQETDTDKVHWLIVHGQYEEAVQRASAEAQERPNDAAAQLVLRDSTLALMLERGRRLTFADQDVEALQVFHDAQALAPDRKEPATWIEKTRHKLAEHYLTLGLEAHASDKLESAIDLYENALKFDPGNRGALSGMAEATIAVNYRAGLGKAYYEEGLRSFALGWNEKASAELGKSDKYLDGPQLELRRKQVAIDLAASRVTVAEGLEAENKFDAARSEYRLALSLDPENPKARVGKESCDVESHVAQIYRDAEMSIVRGRLDKALELTEEGTKLTQKQKDRFEGLKNRVQEARYEAIYKEALAFERDGKFPEAVERYKDLLKIAAYYKDALTRMETLEDYVQRADRLYAAAAIEPDAAKRLEILRQIGQFWPDYRDVADQVRELSKTVRPQ